MDELSDNCAKSPPGQPGAKARPCPICDKPGVERYRPFCSSRCANVDLGRWLGGAYAIPAAQTDEDELSPPPHGS